MALVIYPMAGSSMISLILKRGGKDEGLEYRFPPLVYCFFCIGF